MMHRGSQGSESDEKAKPSKKKQHDGKGLKQQTKKDEVDNGEMSKSSGVFQNFTINDEDKEPDSLMTRSTQVYDRQRQSMFSNRSLLADSVPTRDSVAFYARQRESQVSRQSQLAEELSQMELTQSLVSSKFSTSVVSAMMPQSEATQQGKSRRRPRQSLRYPNVGKLRLNSGRLPGDASSKPADDTDESSGDSEGGN